jgi:hypothetical protein
LSIHVALAAACFHMTVSVAGLAGDISREEDSWLARGNIVNGPPS